jgi:hypothetical protein
MKMIVFCDVGPCCQADVYDVSEMPAASIIRAMSDSKHLCNVGDLPDYTT